MERTDVAEELSAIKRHFEEAPQRARDERDRALREVAARHGLRQVDLIKLSGYSRETVRQALDPAVRAAVHARRAHRQSGQSA